MAAVHRMCHIESKSGRGATDESGTWDSVRDLTSPGRRATRNAKPDTSCKLHRRRAADRRYLRFSRGHDWHITWNAAVSAMDCARIGTDSTGVRRLGSSRNMEMPKDGLGGACDSFPRFAAQQEPLSLWAPALVLLPGHKKAFFVMHVAMPYLQTKTNSHSHATVNR